MSRSLLRSFHTATGIDVGVQEDPQEYILTQMLFHSPRAADGCVVKHAHRFACDTCNGVQFTATTSSPLLFLELPMNDRKTAEFSELLEHLRGVEVLSENRECDTCKDAGRQPGTKAVHIAETSKFLLVTLPVFASREKRDLRVILPVEFDFEGRSFKLKAMVLHKGGSRYSGHYIAVCMRRGRWWRLDDDIATEISFGDWNSWTEFTPYLAAFSKVVDIWKDDDWSDSSSEDESETSEMSETATVSAGSVSAAAQPPKKRSRKECIADPLKVTEGVGYKLVMVERLATQSIREVTNLLVKKEKISFDSARRKLLRWKASAASLRKLHTDKGKHARSAAAGGAREFCDMEKKVAEWVFARRRACATVSVQQVIAVAQQLEPGLAAKTDAQRRKWWRKFRRSCKLSVRVAGSHVQVNVPKDDVLVVDARRALHRAIASGLITHVCASDETAVPLEPVSRTTVCRRALLEPRVRVKTAGREKQNSTVVLSYVAEVRTENTHSLLREYDPRPLAADTPIPLITPDTPQPQSCCLSPLSLPPCCAHAPSRDTLYITLTPHHTTPPSSG